MFDERHTQAFYTWGMIHFPSWVIMETLIQMLTLQIWFWDYFRYSPVVTIKEGSTLSQQMMKRNSDFPKQEWYRCLRDDFLCSLSKFKSYRISPILLFPQKDTTYLQRSLSPAEFSSRMILIAISANSRVTAFHLQYHLISEDDTVYPQQRLQIVQGSSYIFEESISILPQKPEELTWSLTRSLVIIFVQLPMSSCTNPQRALVLPREFFMQFLSRSLCNC